MGESNRPKPSQRPDINVNLLCSAASAVYYEIVVCHARRTRQPAKLPELLCPRGRVPRTCDFEENVLREAEDFLARLGLIAEEPKAKL